MTGTRAWEVTARGGRVLLIGILGAKAARLATDILLGRTLGPEAFGIVAASLSLIYILTTVAQLGVDRGVLRFASVHEDAGAYGRSNALTRRALIIPLVAGTVIVGIVTLLREPLTLRLFGETVDPWLLPLFALGIPLGGVVTVLQFAARAGRRYRADAAVGEVLRNALILACTAVLLLCGWKIWGAAVGSAAGLLLAAILGARIVLRRRADPALPAEESGPPDRLRSLMRVALPLAFASSAGLLLNELDKLMLAMLRSPSEAGLYNAAFRLARQVNLFLPALLASLSPWIAPLIAQGRLGELTLLYRRINRWALALAVSGMFGCWIFAEEMLGLFGPEFVPAGNVLIVVALGQVCIAAAAGSAVFLQFADRERGELRIQTMALSANVLLNLALIPPFGAMGAAVATLAAHLLGTVLRLRDVRGLLGVLPWDRQTGRMLVGSLVSGSLSAGFGLAARGLSAPGPVVLGAAVLGAAVGWVVFLRGGGVAMDDAALRLSPWWLVGRRSRSAGETGRLKILFYSVYPGLSGSHRMALQIAVACREAGHDVIAAAPGEMEFLRRAEAQGLRTTVLRAPEDVVRFGRVLLDRPASGRLAWGLTKLLPYNLRAWGRLRRDGIDLIYAAQERAVVQIGLAARLAGIPLVWHVQSGLPSGSGWVHRVSRLLSTRLVCVSEAVAETVLESLGSATRDRLRVIYNGIPDRERGSERPAPAGAQEPVRVLFAGNVVPEKGAHHLVAAVAAAGRDGSVPLSLSIAGPGPDPRYVEHLAALVREHGLEDRVEMLGYREDVPELIGESDLVVCPSVERETLSTAFGTWEVECKEGFCLVALEAMRAGKPVIASDSYGLKEVVAEGQTGIRVAPGDAASLAAAIRTLAEDPTLRRQMGERGRERFEKNFSLASMAGEFLEEFETALSS